MNTTILPDCTSQVATLCIGLDIAWKGGTLGRPDTQNDCLLYALSQPSVGSVELHLERVGLVNRDQTGDQIFHAIKNVVNAHGGTANVVLALDAPLQASLPIPFGQVRARRACEVIFSNRRREIDRAVGGANGWDPKVQPGAPLFPRIENLLALLHKELGFEIWTEDTSNSPRLVLECFPAESIWAAKRLGAYPMHETGQTVKSYKKQQGQLLTKEEVKHLVTSVLLDGFDTPWSGSLDWATLVNQLIQQMLERTDWQRDGHYRGGKLLDDVVDSALCLATALSYPKGTAHTWFDKEHPDDGHIIGQGPMPQLPGE